MKKSTLFIGTIIALSTFGGLQGTAVASEHESADKDILLHDIELRPGVSADIHLHIHDNPRTSCDRSAILAVHGATGSTSIWEPMAHAIFAEHHSVSRACKFIAMDLPGHGQSSLPRGALFGELSLDDYASAVIGTLEQLDENGIRVREIMSHSLGGLVTQIVQQKLVDQGTSLREAFGVKRAVMLAPALPQAIPSAIGNDPAFSAFLAAFITFDPALGTYLLVPDALFPVVIFSRPDHTLASNAPTPEEVTAYGYNGPESFAAMSQLVGIPPVERPDIDPAIFSHGLGTRLDLVTFENDTLIRPEEGSALYTYLTGDSELSRFTLVEGDDAVHGLPISDPEAVLDAMDETE